MLDRIPGELTALIQVLDTDGDSRLVAILDTPQGAQTGVLVAPRAGYAGALTFQPVPRLQDLLIAQHPDTFSIEAVPVTPVGPTADDPRGLRAGGKRRAPGMTG